MRRAATAARSANLITVIVKLVGDPVGVVAGKGKGVSTAARQNPLAVLRSQRGWVLTALKAKGITQTPKFEYEEASTVSPSPSRPRK